MWGWITDTRRASPDWLGDSSDETKENILLYVFPFTTLPTPMVQFAVEAFVLDVDWYGIHHRLEMEWLKYVLAGRSVISADLSTARP